MDVIGHGCHRRLKAAACQQERIWNSKTQSKPKTKSIKCSPLNLNRKKLSFLRIRPHSWGLLYLFKNITCHWLNFWSEITIVKRSRWSAIFTWSEDTIGARIGILNRNNHYRGIEDMNGKPPSGESNLQPCTAHLSTASHSSGLFPGCSSPQVK